MPDFPNGVPGHVVSMTIDWEHQIAEHVATCECGWIGREPRKAPYLLSARRMDEAVERHWREVMGAANG